MGKSTPKHPDELRAKALVMLETNHVAYVAKKLGLPESTIRDWRNKKDKEEKENGGETFAEIREKNMERFTQSAWKSIHIGVGVILKNLEKLQEKDSLSPSDISRIATVIGTLFDKVEMAMESSEQTNDNGVKVTINLCDTSGEICDE